VSLTDTHDVLATCDVDPSQDAFSPQDAFSTKKGRQLHTGSTQSSIDEEAEASGPPTKARGTVAGLALLDLDDAPDDASEAMPDNFQPSPRMGSLTPIGCLETDVSGQDVELAQPNGHQL